MPDTGGAAKPTGATVVEKNVDVDYTGYGESVRLMAPRIRATLDEDGLRVTIVASAEYSGKTPKGGSLVRLATATYDVPTRGHAADLRAILESLLKEHRADATDRVLEHAYEARAQARRAGEIV